LSPPFKQSIAKPYRLDDLDRESTTVSTMTILSITQRWLLQRFKSAFAAAFSESPDDSPAQPEVPMPGLLQASAPSAP